MNPTWTDLYRHHFIQFLGKPFDVQRFRQDEDGPALDLAIFDQRYQNYRIFASLGLRS